jgi:hypothetical protein
LAGDSGVTLKLMLVGVIVLNDFVGLTFDIRSATRR